MTNFLKAARLLLLDLASTFLFLALFSLTGDVVLSVASGVALGVLQIVVQYLRKAPIEAMEWLSLFLVVAAGATTLLTDDASVMLLKPSIIYVIIGVVMCKPGWMNRYLPQIARTVAPDVATAVGFAWAGLMVLSAVVNAAIALTCSLATWAMVMPIFGLASKAMLFLAGFAAIRLTVRRRLRALPVEERDSLLAAGAP